MCATSDQLAKGVVTASAGNMAQGVAWAARRLGYKCTSIVPSNAPEGKLKAIERLNGEWTKVTREEWWNIIMTGECGMEGYFVHPVWDKNVLAGHGIIGLEIIEELPDVDVILAPYGGGGLSCGIASAIKGSNHHAKVFACEVEGCAPFEASLNAGKPVDINYSPTFVDGIGAGTVIPQMFEIAKDLLDGVYVIDLAHVAKTIKLLVERNRVVAEGAGATPVAIALSGKVKEAKKVVCVVSGGCLDSTKLAKILAGEIP